MLRREKEVKRLLSRMSQISSQRTHSPSAFASALRLPRFQPQSKPETVAESPELGTQESKTAMKAESPERRKKSGPMTHWKAEVNASLGRSCTTKILRERAALNDRSKSMNHSLRKNKYKRLYLVNKSKSKSRANSKAALSPIMTRRHTRDQNDDAFASFYEALRWFDKQPKAGIAAAQQPQSQSQSRSQFQSRAQFRLQAPLQAASKTARQARRRAGINRIRTFGEGGREDAHRLDGLLMPQRSEQLVREKAIQSIILLDEVHVLLDKSTQLRYILQRGVKVATVANP